MDSDEREIYNYLQTCGSDFVSAKEVCRRASTKKRFYDDPDWAKPILQNMVDRGTLERDTVGRFRVKPKSKKHKNGRWVSPEIAELLREKGLDADGTPSSTSPEDLEQH